VKPIRLLPVVIFATVALLLFKGIGLLTTGSTLMDGTVLAATAEHAPTAEEPAAATMTLPPEPTMTDTSPTLDDAAPTMGEEAGGDHGAPAADHGTPAAEEHSTDAAEDATAPAEEAPHGETDAVAEAETVPEVPDLDAPVQVAADPRAEGVPMQQSETGELVPLTAEDGGSLTENIVLERLSVRRAELDAREEELSLRLNLIEAAEAQLEERATALAAVEARINALVDQQKSAQDGQFAAIISMYETMKPGEAATIFNDLDMNVLARVARGMNPRKLAPVLAKMTSARAQQLTLALAAVEPEPSLTTAPGENLAALPQIVGQ
jgi:flagellar motility protein MotE (MotC chaperone)